MGKVLAVVVLVFAIAAGVVFGVPSVRAKVIGVPLRMHFKQGQELKQKMTLDGKVKLEVSGLPPGMVPPQAAAFLGTDIPFKMEMRTKQVVKNVTDDEAEIETNLEGGEMELQLPTGPYKQALPAGPPSTMKMDSKGHVKFDAAAMTPPGVPPEEMKKLQEFFSNLSGGMLSGETKRVGQTWSTDVNLPLTFEKAKVTITGKIENTFNNVESRNSATVAVIDSNTNVSVDVVMTAPPSPQLSDIKLNGTISGKNTGYFDWKAGQIVGSDGNGNLDLKLNVKAPQGPGGNPPTPIDAQAHLTGSMKMSIEYL